MLAERVVHFVLVLLMPPLLLGVINKTKAWFAGRKGPPLLQPYWDVLRLLQKGAVFSQTTSWVFQVSATVQLAAATCAALIVPTISMSSPLGFSGDIVFFAYVLALGRLFTMLAAMDTGSSFEGMGVSREAMISSLAEPALFFSLAILCIPSHSVSFERVWTSIPEGAWAWGHAPFIAAAIALFIVMLAEGSRIPVDDPNTHLELTMVHEVMVLDHSGPDFGYILLGSALKLFLMGSIILHVILPVSSYHGWQGTGIFMAGQIGVAAVVGVVESTSARYRLNRVPHFLLVASVIAILGIAVQFFGGVQ
jgi:formate hydrogenlyase subunit 4